MRKFSKKFIVRGVQFCTPLLLLLVVMAITSLARARPAKAASDFKAFSWEDRKELKKHLSNDKDSNGIEYNKYGFEVNTGADDHYLKVAGERINLKQRCDGKVHDDPKEENKPPYRYWFWVKGNKLRSSGIHWSTDEFKAAKTSVRWLLLLLNIFAILLARVQIAPSILQGLVAALTADAITLSISRCQN